MSAQEHSCGGVHRCPKNLIKRSQARSWRGRDRAGLPHQALCSCQTRRTAPLPAPSSRRPSRRPRQRHEPFLVGVLFWSARLLSRTWSIFWHCISLGSLLQRSRPQARPSAPGKSTAAPARNPGHERAELSDHSLIPADSTTHSCSHGQDGHLWIRPHWPPRVQGRLHEGWGDGHRCQRPLLRRGVCV
jgi:hypothetical protein